ncbi:carboxypeptidase regulatory-like domain-containing protein [Trinickia symbiotica]|uniref:carboxypeptidase regulatory-like domain-containing protein n=1 Tax=Trinickia symbiotica TaxID=863227 RepID=UPI0011B1E305|nr:carboxypeptidase regulatory-like domain-containing protein [Trinickia symbiotica]
MRRHQRKTGLALSSIAILAISLISGCGGGGSSGSASTSTSAPTANATPTTVSGTVAVGSAVANASVTIIGANGATVSATSDSSGAYTASITGLTAPFVIVATDPSGTSSTLVSVVATLPTGTSAPITANVTTLTTAVAALLTTSGNPLDVLSSGNASSLVTSSNVASAEAKLNAMLSSILTDNGLSATSFDPIATAFTPNQQGADAVIDAVELIAAVSGGMQLVSTGNPGSGIALNSGTSTPSPLAPPPAAADYLQSLMSELAQCLSGTSASCTQAIDASYLENGFTSFATAHPGLAASGVTLGLPQTLKFFTSTNGTQEALVELRYTTSSGTHGAATTVVQKTAAGWDIVGNQQPFNVTINSFLARRTFVDTADQQFGRYEAGIGINIPANAATNLAAASVTGPGINGTAYLVPRSGTGNNALALTSTALASVPTAPTTTNSNTTLYRWSWTALPGSTGTFSPGTNSRGFYTPSPIDVTTVPQFATYIVTFYDSTGTQIAPPFNVTNASPTLSASAGAGVPWQTLSSSVLNDFLNPAGALAGTQSSVGIAWSTNTGTANVAPLVSRVQIQTTPGTGVTPSTEVDGWASAPATFAANGQYSATVTAGVDQSGVQECTSACPFPALQAGASRLVQLSWNGGQTSFYNLFKYND